MSDHPAPPNATTDAETIAALRGVLVLIRKEAKVITIDALSINRVNQRLAANYLRDIMIRAENIDRLAGGALAMFPDPTITQPEETPDAQSP